MALSRRQFVQRCSSAVAASALSGRVARGQIPWTRATSATVELDLARQAPFADHDLVRQLVTVAIDAARQRGASYADALRHHFGLED